MKMSQKAVCDLTHFWHGAAKIQIGDCGSACKKAGKIVFGILGLNRAGI